MARRWGRALLAMLLVGLVGSLGCLEPPPQFVRDAPQPMDAPRAPLTVTEVAVEAFDGRAFPLDAMPLRPRIIVTTSAPLTGDPPIYLFRGSADATLLDDLSASPLRREHTERSVPCALSFEGPRIVLVPDLPLGRGEIVTLAVGAWAERERVRLDAPLARTLRVGDGAESGAVVRATWPADGATDVGTEPTALVVAFDGALRDAGGVSLASGEGEIETDARMVDCASLGLSGTCVALLPTALLLPLREHRLVVEGSLDATGAPVPRYEARFRTAGGADRTAPELVPALCHPDEEAQSGLCVAVNDRLVIVRVVASEPVRVVARRGTSSVVGVASRGEVTLAVPHASPGGLVAFGVELEDVSGNRTVLAVDVSAPGPLPRVVITEARPDPIGPEPAQEYVELMNAGTATVSLADFRLADDLSREGDPLPDLRLSPGARVLVVADDFDPDDDRDAPPIPPGTPLARIGTSLGDGGLSAAGEPLVLRYVGGGHHSRIDVVDAARAPSGGCLLRHGGIDDAPMVPGVCTPGVE